MSYTPTVMQTSSQLRSSLANISPHNTPQPSPHSSPGKTNVQTLEYKLNECYYFGVQLLFTFSEQLIVANSASLLSNSTDCLNVQ